MSFPSESERLPTLEALERELVARVDTRLAPQYPRAALATALTALVVAVMTLTPFGRALAERVGDLIGIGDPPSREQENPSGEPAVVVGVGEYGGERFEIVASARAPGAAVPGPGCFSIDFPRSSGTVIAGCMTPELVAAVERNGLAAAAVPNVGAPVAGRPILVTGLVDARAAQVAIESPGAETVHATIGHLTPKLAAGIGLDEDLSYFVAFVPRSEGAPPELAVRAVDRDGAELGRARVTAAAGAPPPVP